LFNFFSDKALCNLRQWGRGSAANLQNIKVMQLFCLRVKFRIEIAEGELLLIYPSLLSLLPLWFFRIVGCLGEREAPPTLKL